MDKLDLTDIDVAVERFRVQLQLPDIPMSDLIEAEASLDRYSRELTKLARQARSMKLTRRNPV
jgi:hypothetical protein